MLALIFLLSLLPLEYIQENFTIILFRKDNIKQNLDFLFEFKVNF